MGNELDGTGKEHDRPVLVIRPFNAETFFGLALIGHPRVGRYYFPLGPTILATSVISFSSF